MRHVERTGERINAHGLSVGKPERKSLLDRPKRKWEDAKLVGSSGGLL